MAQQPVGSGRLDARQESIGMAFHLLAQQSLRIEHGMRTGPV